MVASNPNEPKPGDKIVLSEDDKDFEAVYKEMVKRGDEVRALKRELRKLKNPPDAEKNGQQSAFAAVAVGPAGDTYLAEGLTKREWFAATLEMPACDGEKGLSSPQAAAVMGEECPGWLDNPKVAIAWWIKAEAKYRFMKADAMLKAGAE